MKRLFLVLLVLIMTISMSSCVEAVLYSFEAEGDLSVVFTSDDEFYCYGDRSLFSDGESQVPFKLEEPKLTVDISMTDTTAVMLTNDGIYATGVIADLPFGDPSTLRLDKPTKFYYDEYLASFDQNGRLVSVDLSDAKQIVSGDDYTLVLKKDGTVYGWGSNFYGQLKPEGAGLATHLNTPVKIEGLEGISRIACSGGRAICAALDMDGHVWVWGAMMTDDNMEAPVPYRLDVERAVEITCSSGMVGILDADAQVVVANFTTSGLRYACYQVDGLPEIFSLVACESAFAAKDADGSVWTWGANDLGQLGRKGTEDENEGRYPYDSVPAKVEGLSNVISLSAGKNHFMAMTQNMAVYAWGDNSHGQLGADPGATPYSAAPIKAPKINANVNRG